MTKTPAKTGLNHVLIVSESLRTAEEHERPGALEGVRSPGRHEQGSDREATLSMFDELMLRTTHYSAKENYIYVLSCGRLRKVGRASGLDKRLRALAAMNPYELTLERLIRCPGRDAPKVETFLHKLLEKQYDHGEWFVITPAELDKRLLIALRKFTFTELEFGIPVDRSSCLWPMAFSGRCRPNQHPDPDWLTRIKKDYHSFV